MKIMELQIKKWNDIEQLLQEFTNKPSKVIWCELNKIYTDLKNNEIIDSEHLKYLRIFILAANIRQAYNVYNIDEHEDYVNELNKLITDDNCKKYLKYAIRTPN